MGRLHKQDVEDTGDGRAVLRFGRQSDDLAARVAAVVVHVYTPPPVVDSARTQLVQSPTMEASCRAAPTSQCVHVCVEGSSCSQ